MNAKDIRQLKMMIAGSAIAMIFSFVGTAAVQYGAINVRLDNLEKRDNEIIQQHNRDIDRVENVISTVAQIGKKINP